ncbi:MAG: chromosome segregation protein SMC [Syntrophaceae bacterium]|nr:chromosome segregation protein SMC [Syntrophaceae bacterium]
MKLKRLEIIGFKTFRDRTVIDFSSGISGIVGPNGCGKSNIVDALRWVMGEQRVSVLRGKKMDDVIFNGSEEAPPVGMAEVTLVMESGGYPFPAPYADCSEVMITRRVFRDEEGEYFINKVRCRLLDVKEFFMDTGVGARTYSLVEQGSIASLMEAKPEERRQYIEEAAGITKYKSRKEAAVRKMESTKQNLLRLNDIMREVKSQLNAVSRQARRAERYKQIKKDLREVELALAAQAFTEMQGRKSDLQGRYDEASAATDDARSQLAVLEARIEEFRAEIAENDQLVNQLQEKLYTAKSEIGIQEQAIEHARARLDDLAVLKERGAIELESLRARRGQMEGELAQLEAQSAESDGRIAAGRDELARRQADVDELRKSEQSLRDGLEREKNAYFNALTEQSRLQNALAGYRKSLEDIRRRAEREDRELEEQVSRLALAQESLAGARTGLEEGRERLESLRKEAAELQQIIQRSRTELEEADERVLRLKEELGKKTSRLASLREFQNRYEWCDAGTRSIIRAGAEAGLARDSVHGLVADHIEVPREYEVAVEAALGERLQYVVVKSQEEGIRAIDYLKTRTAGRSSFVPLRVRASALDVESSESLRGTTRLLDVVRVRDEFRSIAEYLLGDTLLVPDLKSGVALWERNGFRGTLVTPDGDMISPHGVLTGGSRAVTEESSLLSRKREIAELEQDARRLEGRLRDEAQGRSELADRIAGMEDSWEAIRDSIREAELELQGRSKDTERFENELKWVQQRVGVIRFNRETLQAEEQETAAKLAATEREIETADVRCLEISSRLEETQRRWQAVKADLEGRDALLTEARVALAALEEKRNADLKALERLRESLRTLDLEVETRQQNLGEADRNREELTAKIEQGRLSLEALYSAYGVVERDLAAAREGQTWREGKMSLLEGEAREARRKIEEMLRETGELDIEIRELAFQIDALRNGMQEKHQADLDELARGFEPLDEVRIAELREDLEKKKRAVEDFGEVNLLAISEHEELQARHDFLSGQISDLNASLDSLQKTIARINQVTRNRFSETFQAVNECFQSVFPKLFRGGKASLLLTDSEDLLETGVDIEIQLPGKRTQNINLLSGGEKSLAAVALIFSILLHKPTPFLILDEVDAALDDANIALFNQFVKDISERSQIVLVTHNKKTMEVSDNLFGVSMEKKGISTLVSVNLNQIAA